MENSLQDVFTPAALPFFDLISDLGTGAPMQIAMLFVFLLLGTRSGIRAGLLFLAGSYVTFILKFLIAAPRPYFVDHTMAAYSLSSGYGMPSGHATHTTAALLPVVRDSRWVLAKLLVLAFIALVALSRVYLGVHYVTQIAAGIAVGLMLFLLVERLGGAIATRMKRQNTWAQILVLALIPVVLFGIDRLYVSANSPEPPAAWQEGYNRAVDARAESRGIPISDPRVLAVKSEFSLVEPRSAEFYASLVGWLAVCFVFLHRPVFTVRGTKHALANVVTGGGAVGLLFVLFFQMSSVKALQVGLLVIAPVLVAYVVPSITERFIVNKTQA